MKSLYQSLALAATFAVASYAHATTISIGLSQSTVNGGAITTVATDGGSGSATYSGVFGNFVFNNVTATGAPIRQPGNLSTTSVQVSNDGGTSVAGTVDVYITEQGLMSPLGASSILSSFTSNEFTGSSTGVVEDTFFSDSNALFGGTLLATDSFTGLGTGAVTTAANLTGPYSETVEYVVTMGAGMGSVNDTIDLTATGSSVTPEPNSLVLLGTGLVGAAGMMFMRRRQAADLF